MSDAVLEELASLVAGDAFRAQQIAFFEQYCGEFDDAEENKLVYTEIHKKYEEQAHSTASVFRSVLSRNGATSSIEPEVAKIHVDLDPTPPRTGTPIGLTFAPVYSHRAGGSGNHAAPRRGEDGSAPRRPRGLLELRRDGEVLYFSNSELENVREDFLKLLTVVELFSNFSKLVF